MTWDPVSVFKKKLYFNTLRSKMIQQPNSIYKAMKKLSQQFNDRVDSFKG